MRFITWQLVRSSTSPAANYAEAQAAESRRDFVHKLQICLKELRETAVWLSYLSELAEDGVDRSAIGQECDELTRIFVAVSGRLAQAEFTALSSESPLPVLPSAVCLPPSAFCLLPSAFKRSAASGAPGGRTLRVEGLLTVPRAF